MCDAFNVLPSQVLHEVSIAPVGLLDEIVEARAYIQAYAAVQMKDAPKGSTPPTPPMERLVREIDAELAHEELNADGRH